MSPSYLLGGGILLDVSHLGRICKQSLDKVKKAYQTGLGVVCSQLTQKSPCHQGVMHISSFANFCSAYYHSRLTQLTKVSLQAQISN